MKAKKDNKDKAKQPFQLPQPPAEVIDAAASGNLVVFVGAGVSRLCGAPDWTGFAHKVVDVLREDRILTFQESEQLKHLADPRTCLSVVLGIAEEKKAPVPFDTILHPINHDGIPPVYDILGRLCPRFVTTNYDKWLDLEPSGVMQLSNEVSDPTTLAIGRKKVVIAPNEMTANLLAETNVVVHLHGSYTQPDSMVITLREYIHHYENSNVVGFLRELFQVNTVLFAGYGLSEFELIQQIVRAAHEPSVSSSRQAFALWPYTSDQTMQLHFMTRFMRDECGVVLVPYRIDSSGYDALTDVLLEWSRVIEVRQAPLIELKGKIDRWISAGDHFSKKSAIKLSQPRTELMCHLLRSLESPEWFDDLDGTSFFEVLAQPTEDDERMFLVIECLRYFKRIAAKLSLSQSQRVTTLLRATIQRHRSARLFSEIGWFCAQAYQCVAAEALVSSDLKALNEVMKTARLRGHIVVELAPLFRRLLSDEKIDDQLTIGLLRVISAPIMYRRLTKERSDEPSYCLMTAEVLRTGMVLLANKHAEPAFQLFEEGYRKLVGAPQLDDDYHVWCPAIEDNELNSDRDYRSLMVEAIRDLVILAADESSMTAVELARALLTSKYITLVRIGIFVCGQRYAVLGSTFWSCLKPAWFVDLEFRHELYQLIRTCFHAFDNNDQNRLIRTIQNPWGRGRRRSTKYDDGDRRDLFHAASGVGNKRIDTAFSQLVSKVGPAASPEWPFGCTKFERIGVRSPVTSDELVAFSAKQLQKEISGFQPDRSRLDGVSFEGFADALVQAVRVSSDGFLKHRKLFLHARRPFQHGLLRGWKERWAADRKEVNWRQIRSFASQIVANESFKLDLQSVDRVGSREPNVRWVATDIADLAKANCVENDGCKVDARELSSWVSILIRLLELIEPSAPSKNNDPLTHAINTPRGHVIEALIRVSVKLRRHDFKTKSVWKSLRSTLDKEVALASIKSNPEFSTLMGLHYVTIRFVLPGWIDGNFDGIFSDRDARSWLYAMHGFSYQRQFSVPLYREFRRREFLQRAVRDAGLPRSIRNKATEFIAIAYINGIDALDQGSPLTEVVSDLNAPCLRHLCWFLWTLRENQDQRALRVPKVEALWLAVDQSINTSGESQAALQSSLSQLMSLLDQPSSEIQEAWVRSASFVHLGHYEHTLVHDLARLVRLFPKTVLHALKAAIAEKLLEYPPEDIRACVLGLAETGHAGDAVAVCEEYDARGSTVLSSIYAQLKHLRTQEIRRRAD